jgi:hypothetical protein
MRQFTSRPPPFPLWPARRFRCGLIAWWHMSRVVHPGHPRVKWLINSQHKLVNRNPAEIACPLACFQLLKPLISGFRLAPLPSLASRSLLRRGPAWRARLEVAAAFPQAEVARRAIADERLSVICLLPDSRSVVALLVRQATSKNRRISSGSSVENLLRGMT